MSVNNIKDKNKETNKNILDGITKTQNNELESLLDRLLFANEDLDSKTKENEKADDKNIMQNNTI